MSSDLKSTVRRFLWKPSYQPCRPESGSDEEAEVPLWQRSRAPLFEAFWQGRLIPGARIESLPFIEACP